MNDNRIHVYTDGSCLVSRKIGGWAVVCPEWILMGNKRNTTNNEMELYAIYMAIRHTADYDEVHIYSDSEYSLRVLTMWAYNWESDGWKKKGGRIRNLELIKSIFAIVKHNPKYVFHKVEAHSGNRFNEKADRFAKESYQEIL